MDPGGPGVERSWRGTGGAELAGRGGADREHRRLAQRAGGRAWLAQGSTGGPADGRPPSVTDVERLFSHQTAPRSYRLPHAGNAPARTRPAGRPVLVVRATRRQPWGLWPHSLPFGADDYELALDREHGHVSGDSRPRAGPGRGRRGHRDHLWGANRPAPARYAVAPPAPLVVSGCPEHVRRVPNTSRRRPTCIPGPHTGHKTCPVPANRGRARDRRPQISAGCVGGWCGSQADNAGSIPVTRSTPRRGPCGRPAVTGRLIAKSALVPDPCQITPELAPRRCHRRRHRRPGPRRRRLLSGGRARTRTAAPHPIRNGRPPSRMSSPARGRRMGSRRVISRLGEPR